ncbi:MAG TPA: sugar phosphate isomerase/epimerase [Chthoniobacterales bacterium]
MRIATAPVNWNNNDAPDYREWTPYPQLIDEMVKAGYSVTEWGMNMPKEPTHLVADLQDRGLTMLGGFVGLELRNPDNQKPEIERGIEAGRFFKAIGGEYLIAADSGSPRRLQEAGHVDPAGGLSRAEWNALTAGLNELGRRLAPEKVKVVFHNHVGTFVETEDETARLLDGTDPEFVGWCLDCGHLTYGGGDTLRLLEKYGDRVGYLHLKDVDGNVLEKSRTEGWSFQKALKNFIFAPLGEGIAQVPEVLQALQDRSYRGWVVIEQDTTPLDPTQNAAENRQYLEGLLTQMQRFKVA